MREILFRGKDSSGKWVESIGLQWDEVEETFHLWNSDGECIPIQASTLGQYTGVRDRDGIKIFEGDVIKELHPEGVKGRVYFSAGFFGVELEEGYQLHTGKYIHLTKECVIVGNIYDKEPIT